MKLPRDVSGDRLVKALRVLGYEISRQTGSHFRLTTNQLGQHHVTIPRHDSLRVGTFAGILDDICAHSELSREELLAKLFGR